MLFIHLLPHDLNTVVHTVRLVITSYVLTDDENKDSKTKFAKDALLWISPKSLGRNF